MLIKAMILHEAKKHLTYLDFSNVTSSHIHIESQIKQFLLQQRQKDAIMRTGEDGGIQEKDSSAFYTKVMATQTFRIQFLNEDVGEWKELDEFMEWIHPRSHSHMIYCSFRTQPKESIHDSVQRSSRRSFGATNDSLNVRRSAFQPSNSKEDTLFTGDETRQHHNGTMASTSTLSLHHTGPRKPFPTSSLGSSTERITSWGRKQAEPLSFNTTNLSHTNGHKSIAPNFLAREKVVGGKPQHYGPLLERRSPLLPESDLDLSLSQRHSTADHSSSSYLSSLLNSVPKYSSSVLQMLNSPQNKTRPTVLLDNSADEFQQSRTHEKLKNIVMSQKLKRKRLLDERPSWQRLRSNVHDDTAQVTVGSKSTLRFTSNPTFSLHNSNRYYMHRDDTLSEELPSSNVSEIGSTDDNDFSFAEDTTMREFYNVLPEPFVNQSLSVKPKFASPRVQRVKRITEPLERVILREEDEHLDPYRTPYRSYVDYYYDHHLSKAPSLIHRAMIRKPDPTPYADHYETFSARKSVSKPPWEPRHAWETCSDNAEAYIEEALPKARKDVWKNQNRSFSSSSGLQFGRQSPVRSKEFDDPLPNPYGRIVGTESWGEPPGSERRSDTMGFRSFRPYNTILGTLEEDDQRDEMQRYYELRRRET